MGGATATVTVVRTPALITAEQTRVRMRVVHEIVTNGLLNQANPPINNRKISRRILNSHLPARKRFRSPTGATDGVGEGTRNGAMVSKGRNTANPLTRNQMAVRHGSNVPVVLNDVLRRLSGIWGNRQPKLNRLSVAMAVAVEAVED